MQAGLFYVKTDWSVVLEVEFAVVAIGCEPSQPLFAHAAADTWGRHQSTLSNANVALRLMDAHWDTVVVAPLC